jgi:hypothetical protein
VESTGKRHAISQFHNDLPAEKLAIGWHTFGLFQSLMKVCFSIALAYISNACWDALNLGTMIFVSALGANAFLYCLDMVKVLFWCAWAGAVIGGGGVFWHMWAFIQHRDHIRALRAAE